VSLEENKAIVRHMVEAFNKHDVALLDEFIAPDYFDHRHQLRGLESYKQFLTTFFKGFPDYHETIDDIIAEGDYLGIAPTGTKIAVTSVVILRIVNGKVAEWREFADFPSLLNVYKQLGVIEYTEKGKKLFPEDVS
jgi:C-1 hydroxylase